MMACMDGKKNALFAKWRHGPARGGLTAQFPNTRLRLDILRTTSATSAHDVAYIL